MSKIHLNIFFFILLIFSAHGQTWQPLGDPIHGEHIRDNVGRYFDTNDKGDKIIIGYSNYVFTQVKVFQYQNNKWEQMGDTLKEPERDSEFGFSVTMNGTGHIIGISAFDSKKNGIVESGNTKMFEYDNGHWNEIGNINGTNKGDRLGIRIESNKKGNVFAIAQQNSPGAPEGYSYGKITVFEKKGSEWVQNGNAISEIKSGMIGQQFSLDSAGTTLACTNYVKDKDELPVSCIDIYKFKNGVWAKCGKSILNDNPHWGDNYISLSGNGKYLILGMLDFNANDLVVSGRIKVYKIGDQANVQIGKNIDGEKKYDRLGSSVDINDQGNIIAIGTSRKTEGYVKIFRNENGKWMQVGEKLKGSRAKLNGKGDIVVIGNPFENDEEGIIQSYIFR